MAVQINVKTKTPTGADVPAGAIACFSTMFPAADLTMIMNFTFYPSLQAVRDRATPIVELEGVATRFIHQYTIEEFAVLDQGAIEETALNHMKDAFGVDNCVTITKDLLQPL